MSTSSNVASSNIGELELEDSIITGDCSLVHPRIGTFVHPGISASAFVAALVPSGISASASSANATNTSSGDSSGYLGSSGTVKSGSQSGSPPAAKVANISAASIVHSSAVCPGISQTTSISIVSLLSPLLVCPGICPISISIVSSLLLVHPGIGTPLE